MLEFLNRRYSIGFRIGLIAALGAMPIVLLLFLFLNQVWRDIRFTQQELGGAAYLAEIWPQVTAAASGAPGPPGGEAISNQAQAFQAGEAAKAFATARGAEKVGPGLVLIQAVADGSNLTLDTELDSFYFMNAATADLPRLLAASVAAGRATTAQDRAVAAAQAQVYASDAADSIRAATTHDATGHSIQALASRGAVLKTAARALADQAPATPSINDAAPRLALQRVIDDTWKADLAELIRLLDGRLAKLERALAINLGLVLLTVSLAGLLMIGTARGLTDRLRHLVRTMDRLNAKDTSVDVPFLSDTNETGRIAATLAAFKSGLVEVAEERMRADEEYRRAESAAAALSESEARFRSLAEQATDIIVRYDAAGVIEYASPSIRQLGLDPERAIGSKFADLFVEEARARLREILPTLMRDGQMPEGERPISALRRPDGELVWLEGNPSVIHDAANNPVGAVTVLRDVTVRIALEAELRAQTQRVETAMEAMAESEARYRMLAERISDVIVRYDTQGLIEYVSPSVRQLGYEPEDVVGRHVSDFAYPEDYTGSVLATLNEGGQLPIGDETRILRADGEIVWLQGHPSPIKNEAGDVIGVVTSLRDVTERHAIEEELRRRRLEAEAAANAKAQFLANMSHEIRTPLTGVLGFADLLERMDGLPEKAKTYLQRITRCGEALLSLVNDILDISKIESGQIRLDAQPVDLRAFLAETVDLVRPQATKKGLELRSNPAPTLPAFVSIDAARVRQVLLNLVGNAIKFTARGRISIAVSYLSAGEGFLLFVVKDTGVGISPYHADRLFQRFSQVDDSNTRQFGGAGLGLAISKGLVERCGGEIGVHSDEGRGSTFWFTVAAPTADQVPAPEPREAETPALAPLRILVVDDVPVNRELVSALLSPFDLEVEEAADGLEAVEAAQRTRFDLILMDLQMPRMDGLAAAREIRATSACNKATPILAVSANILPEHVEACQRAGMNDHVGKPISPQDLLNKIDRWTAPAGPPRKRGRRAASSA